MNCPKCGTSIADDQNFCRDCGEQLLARPPVSRLQLAGLGVLAMMFIGLLVAMFGKMFAMKWLSYSGLVVMFIAMFIMAAYAFLKETRPRKRVPALENMPSLAKANTTNKLPPVNEKDHIPPSIVENTTDLLEIKISQ